MRASSLPAPGVVLGAYPERRVLRSDRAARLDERVEAWIGAASAWRMDRYQEFVDAVRARQIEIDRLGEREAIERLHELRARLARDGFATDLLATAFALVDRACGAAIGMRAFDTQIIAARIMLDGRLAEMATGEGKTLAAALCAATAALAGIPVHVITVNDYLAGRDAESFAPVYASLGLRVGAVTRPVDGRARREAYRCDIVYCTAKELAFDYLRDGVALGHRRDDLRLRARRIGGERDPGTLLRGLCMAIVDEADSVLIDEARVPLILSQSCSNAAQRDYHAHALRLAGRMQRDRHFTLDFGHMAAELTAEGADLLDHWCEHLGRIWRNRLHREETLCTALSAIHLYQRDRQYVVQQGKVLIVDEATGRLAPGRVWSRGLHQLIELKEGCEPSGELVTAAQITFQRFFRRYLRLGGMSGTLAEARAELRSVYGLTVVRVPLRKPSRRRLLPTQLFPDRDAQFAAVVERTRVLVSGGRPVLIGTDSVADSEALAARLTEAGIVSEVLNARHDAREAEIVAQAGRAGQVTVATNMAGRGTDIPLAAGVAERGGLHLICCQHNASRRIDRQLLGRVARQGDPGSAESLLALDRPRISRLFPGWLRSRVGPNGLADPAWLIALAVRAPQWLEERAQRAQRRVLCARDEKTDAAPGLGTAAE